MPDQMEEFADQISVRIEQLEKEANASKIEKKQKRKPFVIVGVALLITIITLLIVWKVS